MKLRDKQLRSQLSNTTLALAGMFLWKLVQAAQFIVDHTSSRYHLLVGTISVLEQDGGTEVVLQSTIRKHIEDKRAKTVKGK